MHTCHFCQRDDFSSLPSFYAHLRWCLAYPKNKKNQTGKAPLGTALREAVPQGQHAPQSREDSSSLPAPRQPNDPVAPFTKILQGAGLLPPDLGGTPETPQQKRRRLLQTAKRQAINQYWSVNNPVTSAMRAAANLTIDRELRTEPLEEFTPQEVNELAEGIRERVYTSLRHQQENGARRTQEAEARKQAAKRDQDRQYAERTRKKAAFIEEARRRAVTLLKTRDLSFTQRLQVLEEILTQFDAALTGDESLPEAYASIDAVLQARIAEWGADDAATAAREQDEWVELGVAVIVIISLWFMYAKGPDILLWLRKILSPEGEAHAESAQKPTTNAPSQASNECPSRGTIKWRRRSRPSPAVEPPSRPPYPESENIS